MLSSPGIGSGLDVNGIVSQLMAIERQPLAALDNKEAKQQTRLTAFGSLKGALSTFQSSLSALSDPAKFTGVTANFADATLANVSATSSAAVGSHSVEIQTLAQSHKLKSANFATTSTTLGSGTLTIQFGTYSGGTFTLNPDKAAQSITISSDNSSLAGVRDTINQANAGVTASIVNDGSGNRLVIASNDTGLSNALKITTTDADTTNTDNAGLSQLVYDSSTGGTTNLTQTVAAINATLVIDGFSIINTRGLTWNNLGCTGLIRQGNKRQKSMRGVLQISKLQHVMKTLLNRLHVSIKKGGIGTKSQFMGRSMNFQPFRGPNFEGEQSFPNTLTKYFGPTTGDANDTGFYHAL